MPLDGITLYALLSEINNKIIEAKIDKIYQPNTHDVLFFLRKGREEIKLLLSCHPMDFRISILGTDEKENPITPPPFCMLLRKLLQGGRIIKISQLSLERIITIKIENLNEYGKIKDYFLIAELMGKHSNIILVDEEGTVLDAIKKIGSDVNRVREILPGQKYAYPPAIERINILTESENKLYQLLQGKEKEEDFYFEKWILDNFCGFSKVAAKEILYKSSIENKEITQIFLELRRNLNERIFIPTIFYEKDNKKPFDFWVFPVLHYKNRYIEKKVSTVNDALEVFYKEKHICEEFTQLKNSLLKQLQDYLKKQIKILSQKQENLSETKNKEKYKIYGELILANSFKIKQGDKQVILYNFYNNAEESIILDEKLTPSQNAQKYFNLYKKLSAKESIIKEQIDKINQEIYYIENTIFSVENAENLEELYEIEKDLEKEGVIKTSNRRNEKVKPSEPLKFISSEGFTILVGKNNRQNDYITFKKASSEDIWLHVKDFPGSHVVILTEGKKVSESTLLEAGILAAFYSKARHGSKIAVDFTLKKYVKKPQGAKPGYVIYDNYKTLFVTPEEEIINKLFLKD
ncbi:Rqc2 family fibronectin-binding protein [Thermovenabulum sp.]|uniref:Rqc2 family fibronectin-binding protein n=1 Tax=Thermovenabulum sp. TaxID=3100335 RepID=UPI003C7A6BBC